MSDNVFVRYVAVAHLADRMTIASYASVNKREVTKLLLDKKLQLVLGSSRVHDHTRLTITDREVGNIHFEKDTIFLYLVVCVPEYAQREAFKLLRELRTSFMQRFSNEIAALKVQNVSRHAKCLLSAVAQRYNDAAVQEKLVVVALQKELPKTGDVIFVRWIVGNNLRSFSAQVIDVTMINSADSNILAKGVILYTGDEKYNYEVHAVSFRKHNTVSTTYSTGHNDSTPCPWSFRDHNNEDKPRRTDKQSLPRKRRRIL